MTSSFSGHSASSTSSSLLQRATAGEQRAWAQLVDLYSPIVYAKCRSSGLDPADSNDVMQEVFRKVFAKLHKFQPDGNAQSFRRWLRTITRHAMTDFQRRAGCCPRGGGGSDAQVQLQQMPAPFSTASSLSGSDSALKVLVRRALDVLRGDFEDRTWQAFWLTAVEGKSATDVAAELGLAPGTVRQAKYKILKRLREELDEAE